MATTRINAVSATATTFAGDDFLPIDGNVNATRRLLLTSLFASPSAIGSVTPAAGTFTSLSGTNINGTLGATTPSTVAATTISATGKFTAGSGSYSAGDGSIYVGASTGLTLVGKAGSTYDVFISTAGGQALLTNPTGTANVVIGNGIGTISAANSLAVTGALSSTTGANFATSSGDVGIGTASPAGKLQVTGSSASFIFNTTGTEFYNTNAGTVKIYASNAAGALALSAGGRDAGDLFINSSGNVGIGTTSPTAVLHVVPSGTTNITGVLIAGAVDRTGSATAQAVSALKLTTAISPENNASAPGRSIYGLYANLGTMTGVSGAANNTCADIVITPATVSTPGGGNLTNRMGLYIDAAPAGATNNYAIYNTAGTVYLGTGNVGIGTTSPASILHLKKDGSGNGVSTTFEVTTGTSTNWRIGCQNNVNNGFEITPSTSAGGSTFSTPVVTVTTTGAAITGTLSATGTITSTSASRNALSGALLVSGANPSNATASTILDNASGEARIICYGLNSSTRGTFTMLGISSDGSLNSTYLTANSTGLGIGTASPVASASSTATVEASGCLVVGGAINAHQTNRGVFQFDSNTTSIRSYGATAGTGLITFHTGGGGGSADTERMRIDSSGNVGIGTASPGTTLDVQAANASFRVYGTGASDTPQIQLRNGSQIWQQIVDGADSHKWKLKTGGGTTVLNCDPSAFGLAVTGALSVTSTLSTTPAASAKAVQGSGGSFVTVVALPTGWGTVHVAVAENGTTNIGYYQVDFVNGTGIAIQAKTGTTAGATTGQLTFQLSGSNLQARGANATAPATVKYWIVTGTF